jgi:hypothetical protein
MAKVKTEKLDFSKFFPKSSAYVSVTGTADGSDDFAVRLKIGDGDDAVTIITTDFLGNESLAALKAIQEGVTKAIEFQQKALKLPKVESVWPFSEFAKEVKPAAKKAAPKRVLKSTETVVKASKK